MGDAGDTPWDLLAVDDWVYLHDEAGWVRVDAGLPDRVRNPRGQLFGGYTGMYVDVVALRTVSGPPSPAFPPRRWLATASMTIEYFEPITGPRFVIDSEVEKSRGRTHYVATRFVQDGELAVLAHTRVRELSPGRPVGDQESNL